MRSFDYRAEQRGALRAYQLRRAPLGRGEATLYPFARSCGFAGSLGVRAAYERMATLDSTLGGRSLPTTASAYQIELVGRLVLGQWVVSPAAGYYARSYVVAEGVIPRVHQDGVGVALDGRLRVGAFVLELGAGARSVVAVGQLDSADWFPDLAGMTYVGRMRVGGAMTSWLDALVGVALEYSSFDFKIQQDGGALYPNGVATGAYDAYFTALASLRLHLPAPTR